MSSLRGGSCSKWALGERAGSTGGCAVGAPGRAQAGHGVGAGLQGQAAQGAGGGLQLIVENGLLGGAGDPDGAVRLPKASRLLHSRSWKAGAAYIPEGVPLVLQGPRAG